MSKFLDLVKAHLPQKEQKVLPKRNIPPRERPRPTPGANAPMEISKGSVNPVDEQVSSFVELLFSKGIPAQKSKSQPDLVRVKTGNGTVMIKVLPEEDAESDIMPQVNNIAKDVESRVQQPAIQVTTAYNSLQPQIVKAGQEELKRTQDVLKDQSKRMKV